MHSDPEKSHVLRDVAYAMRQAFAFRAFHSSGAPDLLAEHYRDTSLIHNAILESSLAFLRRLNEFFGGQKDVSAADFVGPSHVKWLLEMSDKKLIDQCIMHVTLTEAKQGTTHWDPLFAKYLADVVRHYRLFVDAVVRDVPHLVTPETRTELDRTERLLRIYMPGLALNQSLFGEEMLGIKR